MRLAGLFGAMCVLAACQPQAVETPTAPPAQQSAAPTPATREIALVANSIGATVSLFDVAAAKVVGTIDINPEKVVVKRPGTPNYAQDTDISPDGRTLYVSRGYMGDVAAFDIATGKPLWKHSLNSGRADHMTITHDGKWLFVSVLYDSQVEKIDAATGEGKGRFVSGVYPHDNQISEDGKRVYNTSLGDLTQPPNKRDVIDKPTDKSGYAYQITIADVDTLQVLDRIRMPVGIRPWHMRPGEGGFYAQLSDTHAVVAYDFPSGKETRRLELPVKPGVTEADWDFSAPHHGLSLSHDGTILCLAGRASDYAALVKAPELELLATVPTDDGPGWATLADHDQVCLVANTRADNLSVISVAERKEIARVPMGDGPKHITVAQIPADVIVAAQARP